MVGVRVRIGVRIRGSARTAAMCVAAVAAARSAAPVSPASRAPSSRAVAAKLAASERSSLQTCSGRSDSSSDLIAASVLSSRPPPMCCAQKRSKYSPNSRNHSIAIVSNSATCPKKHTRPRCSARSTWSSWACTCASVPLYSSLPRVKRSVCSRLPMTRTTSNATAPPPSPPPPPPSASPSPLPTSSPSPSPSASASPGACCCDAERTVPRNVTTARDEASLITPRASTGLPPARASVLPVSAHSAAIARVVLPAPLLALSSSSSAAYPPSSSS
eukprot:scaffold32804_cov41-Phaeocystis_antarctica.AAC.2